MSKKKKILLMLAKGGVPQSEVAAVLHVSKRDVSACARVLRERGLAFDDVAVMGAAEVDALLAPPGGGAPESAYLRPDMGPLIERKRRNRKLTVKMFWMEHCEAAAAAGRSAYSYQTFCEMFSRAAERAGATRRLAHEPGASTTGSRAPRPTATSTSGRSSSRSSGPRAGATATGASTPRCAAAGPGRRRSA